MNLPVLLSFGLYLLLMLGIGIYFYRITHNLSDYTLGGRGLPPSIAVLIAVVIVSRMHAEPAASACFDRLMKHWRREAT